MMRRTTWVLVCAMVMGAVGAQAGEIPKGKIDAEDPEVDVIRKLDFESVDYKAEPIKTRVTALIALNQLLNNVGKRSAERLEMLEAFIKAQNLESALMASEAKVPDIERLTVEDGKKIAVAFIKTERGAEMFGPRVPKGSDSMLANYEQSYLKLSRKRWAEVAYTRHQIESIAVFLDSTGKFDTYQRWTIGEEKRRAEARAAAAGERAEQKEADAKAAKERAQERELARMEYAFQLKQKEMDSKAKVAEAAYRSGNNNDNNWNRWGDYYGRVYGRRVVRKPGHPVTKPKPRPRSRR